MEKQKEKRGKKLKFPKLKFLTKDKAESEAEPEEDISYHLSGKEREKLESEIKYYLSISHTPQQIYDYLKEKNHPAHLFVDFINEEYLTDFIHDSFTRGFTIEQIKEELENWKWPREKIDEGITNFLKKKNY